MAKTPTIPHTSEDDPVAALVGSDGALTAEGERRANVANGQVARDVPADGRLSQARSRGAKPPAAG